MSVMNVAMRTFMIFFCGVARVDLIVGNLAKYQIKFWIEKSGNNFPTRALLMPI
jgi:hypothetical protein